MDLAKGTFIQLIVQQIVKNSNFYSATEKIIFSKYKLKELLFSLLSSLVR